MSLPSPRSLSINRILTLLMTLLIPAASFCASDEVDDDLFLIELEGFEVFSNSMKIIDGFTGKEYDGSHAVVLGFRREFDNILTKYHKKLLSDEFRKLKDRTESIKPSIEELSTLAASFGMEGFSVDGPFLTREYSIFRRMLQDPFFKIEELVVWDLAKLRTLGDNLPKNKYAQNIRFDEESGRWERRVTTKWEISYVRPNQRRDVYYAFKEQGLNLDTNRGYHLVDRALPSEVPPRAFRDVDLQYPIFINQEGNTEEQIEALTYDFVENLIYLYDPFSWVGRGNTRFRGGFRNELREHLRKQKLRLSDRDWFVETFSHFLNNVVTMRHWGPDEIYDLQILRLDRKNRNQLGEDLDLLNWHENEKRAVDYDPNATVSIPRINFGNGARAHYILLDAYRRYGDKFLDALRGRLRELDQTDNAKRLVKEALEEASGIPADKYIAAAAKAQQAELARFLRQ